MTLDFIGQVLLGIFVPAIVCSSIFLLRKIYGNGVSAIAITIGFLVGYIFYALVTMEPTGNLWPKLTWNFKAYHFPPTSLKDWLPHVAVFALLLGLLESLWLKNLWIRWITRLIALELLLWQLLKGFFKVNPFFPDRHWKVDDALINFGITTLVIAVFWLLLDILVKRYSQLENSREQAILPTALVIILSGSAISIILGHSLASGQLNGSFTATLGAIMLLSWLFAGWGLSSTTTPIIALLQGMFWVGGYFFADLPYISAILLALALSTLLIPLTKLRLWQRTILQTILVSLPVALAVFYTFQATSS